MGAVATIDSLGVGQSVELLTARGERAMATGIAAVGGVSFATLRAVGLFYVTDPQFAGGAKGDGITNDRPAIVAADLAAFGAGPTFANGGQVIFPDPAVAYLTDQELVPSVGASWLGQARGPGPCTIRASVTMRSVITVHMTTPSGVPTNWTFPGEISGLTLDANNLAKYGMLLNGAFLSRVKDIFTLNPLLDGLHYNGQQVPAQLSAVALGGGATQTITLSQPDTGYIGTVTGATINIVLKVAAGATTFNVSQDGGATFATYAHNLIANAPANISLDSLSTPGNLLGIQFQTGSLAGVAAGWTWSFSVTIPAQDAAAVNAINADAEINNIWGTACGYADNVGTVTATVNSKTVVGVGTTWLTGHVGKQARPGDSITIGVGGSAQTYLIGGVLDDTTLLLSEIARATQNGLGYSLNIGYGIYEDDCGDQARTEIHRGRTLSCANGARLLGASDGGPEFSNFRIDQGITANSGVGIACGGLLKQGNALLRKPEVKSGYGARFYLQAGNTFTIYEPTQQVSTAVAADFSGNGIAAIDLLGTRMRYSPQGSGVTSNAGITSPLASAQIVVAAVSLSAGGQLINPPDTLGGGASPNTSWIVLTPTADFLGPANAPTFGPPTQMGQLMWVQNAPGSQHLFEIYDSSITGIMHLMGGSSVCFSPGDAVCFFAGANSFNPTWQQFGPCSREFVSLSQKSTSATGDPSRSITTTTNANFTLQLWDLVFAPNNGFAVSFDVSAINQGTGDEAFWMNCMFAVNSAGAIIASVIPATNAAGQFGTNATLAPAGYALSVNKVGNQILVQATTGANVTTKWFIQHRQIGAVRT